ncbi:hypothetical protein [Deinococcus ruber]|uniref:hypothetical protein n=1 Tax=Deinococcus ruber TaxID=1848197 RepID=UPI0016695E1C|nr:hypothetical protein [Deinococcus ruber]
MERFRSALKVLYAALSISLLVFYLVRTVSHAFLIKTLPPFNTSFPTWFLVVVPFILIFFHFKFLKPMISKNNLSLLLTGPIRNFVLIWLASFLLIIPTHLRKFEIDIAGTTMMSVFGILLLHFMQQVRSYFGFEYEKYPDNRSSPILNKDDP